MRVRGKGATLHGAEGASPPLPYIEVGDEEAAHLIRIGVATSAEDEPVVQEPAQEPPATTEPETVAEPEPVATEPEAVVQPEPAVTDPEPEVVVDPAAARLADIAEAIELLDTEDFVKTGPRAGKPKVKPLEDVLGVDLTAEEVDAAFALREAASA